MMVIMPKKILLLNFLLFFFQTKCENIFFISKSNKNDLTYCITDSEFAMNWINTNLEEISQVSNYVPHPAKRIPFKTENWLSRWNISNDVVLDRRWEKLKIIFANNSNHISLFKSLHVNFDIPFSVRSDNIHMFFCDGRSVPQSSCYWFSLENFNATTKAAASQCSKRAIIFPDSKYKACDANQNQSEDLGRAYISNNYWSHFKLSKRYNFLSLDHFNGSGYNTILKYFDPNPDLVELIIHSKSSNSFWKIHEGEYLHTSTEGSNIFWENFQLLTEKNEICVSFYILMCQFCRLKLILKKEDEIVTTKIYDNTSKWSNMKFFAENLPPGNYNLSLTTVGTVENKDQFWVIDEIRECRKKEFRIIRSFEGTNCQLMSHPENVISIKHSVSRKLNTSSGIEQILSQQKLYDNEENEIKLCSSHFEKETVCWCQKGFYGDTCKNKCECNNRTNQECDDITGRCFYCPLYYTGTKCNISIPPIKDLLVASKNESYIYLKWKPTILSHNQLSQSYQIKLFSGHETLNLTITNSSHCDIWPEYLCYAIDNLKNNSEYTIEINTNYFNETDFERIDTGPTTTMRVITKTEPSEAPYDLNLIWNEENDLILEWKHPNQSNGDILYYTINFPFNNRNYSLKTDNHNLTYHYEVPKIVPAASQFVVEISAFNGYEGKKLIESSSSPPDIPSLAEKPEISESANTIKISILPRKPSGILKSELYLFLLISGKSDNFSDPELTKFDLNNLKTVMRCNLTKGFGERLTFVIGNGVQASNCDEKIANSELKPETNYNVTVVLRNTFRMKDRYKIYSLKCSTIKNGSSLVIVSSVTTLLVLLLFTTSLVIYFVRTRRKQQLTENRRNIEMSSLQRPQPSAIEESDENSFLSSHYERIDEITENEPDEYGTQINESNNLPKIPSNDSVNNEGKNLSENESDEYCPEIYRSLLKREHNEIPSNYNNIGERDLSALLGNTKISKTILVKDFIKYVNNLSRGDELEQQFNTIFDENCSEYEPTTDREYYDYIDMTYLDGSVIKKAYVATNLSTKGTVEDFWKIIWDDNVRHIILHKGYYEKQEFKRYWPQNNESLHCHGILVKLISSRTLEKFHYRKFLLICNFEMKEVDQIQFPYNGLNPRKFVPLLKKMEKFSLECDKPIMIHSSQGLANVGLILLCDMSLRMAKKENLIDVCKNLQELAKNNIELAGNIVQYGFVHTIILKYLTSEENYEYPEQSYYLNY